MKTGELENVLFEVMNAVTSNKSMKEVLNLILDSLPDVTNCSMCSIQLVNEETQKLKLFCKKGDGSRFHIRVPMIISGRTTGEINLYHKDKRKFSRKFKRILSMIASCGAVAVENNRLNKMTEIFASLANIDGLTQLYNHKYFHEALEKELSKARRFGYSVCMAMIDIDHFKRYNDNYGHPAGDVVLKKIAEIIKKNIRSYDLAARYGGEEIALILSHATRQQAIPLAERMRTEILAYPFKGKNNEKVKVSVSIGLASYPDNATTKAGLVERVDQALYLAKEEGRNRICSSLISSKDLIKFAFCPPAFTSPYYTAVLKGVKEVIKDIGNTELFIETSDGEAEYAERQLKIIEKFIKEKVDVIAICSQAREAIGRQIEKVNKKKIPVFVFNAAEPMPSGKVVSYIGYDNREAGKLVGGYLVRLLRGKGRVAILEGLPEITSVERKNGFMEVIKDYRGIRIVASERADWERNMAREVAGKILKKCPKLDAFFGVSDEMALGAVDIVKKTGRKGKIFTIGLDGNQNAFQSIKAGELTATLNTNPVEMGRTLMRTIMRSMIKEEKIKNHIWLPIMMVDLENVDQYIIK